MIHVHSTVEWDADIWNLMDSQQSIQILYRYISKEVDRF